MIYRNDKSAAGVERWMVASKAFERHDPTRRFAKLNGMVQEHWLAVTDAVMAVMREAPAVKEKPLQQTHLRQKTG